MDKHTELKKDVMGKCFIKLLSEYVIPLCFEHYWSKVLEMRVINEPGKKPDNINQICMDIFVPGLQKEEKVKKESPVWISVVPKTRYHWDVILAMYSLLNQDNKFQDTKVIARAIHNVITDDHGEFNDELFDNVDRPLVDYLYKFSRGETLELGNGNLFFENPSECIYMIKHSHIMEELNIQPENVLGFYRPKSKTLLTEELSKLRTETENAVKEFFVPYLKI